MQINAKGLWLHHRYASFMVEIKGTSGDAAGKVWHQFVSFEGDGDFDTYQDTILTKTLKFSNIPEGTYLVTARSSLRTISSSTGKNVDTNVVIVHSGSSQTSFHFECNNYAYLSGEAAATNGFVVP